MKHICMTALCIIISLTACATSDSVSQTPVSNDPSFTSTAPSVPELALSESMPSVPDEIPPESMPSAPGEAPPEERISAITPANSGRIQEKKTENEDVVGWLTVPGTDIDSVIVHSSEKDNGFYTNHDFAGNPSRDGFYFADTRCDFTTPTREGLSQNIALYAHSWDENPDGQLFAQLKRFKDSDFAQRHPYIFFSTEAEDMAWEVFAVYNITVEQPYIIPDLPWASLSEMLNIVYAASLYDYGIRLTESDKILTLSTCSFDVPGRALLPFDKIPNYRFVVMARLASPDDVHMETATLIPNNNPLPPDDMPVIYSHHADVIQFEGTLYNNLARSHADKIPEIEPSRLIPVGAVVRSGIMRDLQDFDATKLPKETPLYLLQGYKNLLVAKVDEATLVYGYGMS